MVKTRLLAIVLAALSGGCGGPTKPGGAGITPLPRSIQVDQDRVVVEGRWFPIEPLPDSPALPNAVRVVCLRADRSCKEDLTRIASESGTDRVHETLEYRVDDWTAWGKPAGKLTASRRVKGAQIEIRVFLNGGTAEKVVIEKGRETRWRIE